MTSLNLMLTFLIVRISDVGLSPKGNIISFQDYRFILLICVNYHGRFLNFVDRLKLDNNTVGCRLRGLDIKRLRARSLGSGSEPRGA